MNKCKFITLSLQILHSAKNSTAISTNSLQVKNKYTIRFHKQTTMALPKRKFFVWQDCNTELESSNRFVQIAFDFITEKAKQRFYMKRPYTDKFSATKRRLATKIQNLLTLPENEQYDVIRTYMADGTLAQDEATNYDVFFGGNRCDTVEIGGASYAVIRDAVWLDKVEIALQPLVGCPIMPSTDWKNTSENVNYHWFIGEKKCPTVIKFDSEICRFEMDGWTYAGTNPYYCPTEQNLGMFVAVMVDYGEEGMVCACSCDTPVSRPNDADEQLIFEQRQQQYCKETTSGNIYRVVCYNVLAHLYLNESLKKKHQSEQYFAYCPIEFQLDKYRYPIILRELPGYNADLLFLQEVDFRFQRRFLLPFLKFKGYTAIFNCKGNRVNEGHVIAFRNGRFEFVDDGNYSQKLSNFLLEDPVNSDILKYLEDKPDIFNTLKTRPSIIQLIHLRTAQGLDVLAANTHLHFDPSAEEVRILQALLCVRYINKVIANHFVGSMPQVLFAGDFNAQPDSNPVTLIQGKQVTLPIKPSGCTHSFFEHVKSLIAWLNTNKFVIQEAMPFQCVSGFPEYTNYTRAAGFTGGFLGCLDYVWAYPRIQVERIVPMPEHDLVIKYGALPSKIAPSDHMPSVCDLYFPSPS